MGKYIDSDGQELKVEIDIYNTKRYYNSKGQYHRLDGPAVEFNDQGYIWYKNNKLHRIGGPTVMNIRIVEYWWFSENNGVNVYYICG